LASLVFAFAVFRGELFRWVLTRPLITTIGGMCYTIYLFHYPIIAVAYRITEHAPIGRTFWPNAVVQSLLVTPMVLAVTGVLFLALEKPCMDPTWPRKVAARFRGAVTPDQSGG
jgi:peptidoglycan/LPS O-acetylase OafA/YrhL